MKLNYQYEYVPEGQDEPDRYGRWAIRCYIETEIKTAVPEYSWVQDDFIEIPIAYIKKYDSPHFKYMASLCCMADPANIGFSQRNIYSETIDEMKAQIQEQMDKMELIFKYCRK